MRRIKKYLTAIAIIMVVSISGITVAQEGSTEKININKASNEDLTGIPLITKEMADSVIEYRDQNGDFLMLNELLSVDGFNAKTIKRLTPYLTLEELGSPDC